MDKQKQPGIRFKNVVLKNLSFSREAELPENNILDVTFNSSKSLSENGKQLAYVLGIEIKEKNNAFSIACSAVGFFEIDDNNANMQLDQFSDENAPALIFPYLREIVSSTTLKAGMDPVVLPPVNIRAMLNSQKK